jgi:membrane protease YdiL (CAAX protease family)
MTDLVGRTQTVDSRVARFWQRIPAVVRAVFFGFLVTEFGVIPWVAAVTLLPGLWPVIVMGCVLWVYCKYFSGSWWPEATAEARRNCFRALELSPGVWKWGLVAALLFVVIGQSSLVLTFRMIEFPAELFTQQLNFDALPLWVAWLFIVTSSLAAGICEETGFRGYMQVPLEKRYGPGVAITIVSAMFLVLHLNQAWAPPVLFHLFALGALFGILAHTSGSLIPSIVAHVAFDVFNFSYWWSDVAGRFEMQTIAVTGVDLHFVAWSLIFVASTVLFFWAARKTLAVRQLEAG